MPAETNRSLMTRQELSKHKNEGVAMFERLLKIENDSNLWNYEVNGYHIWPIIRRDFYDDLLFGVDGPIKGTPKGKRTVTNRLKTYLEYVKVANFFRKGEDNFDSLFITHSRNQRFDSDTRLYHDLFYTPYIEKFEKPLIFETSFKNTIKKPRVFENSTFIFDYIAFASEMKFKFNRNKLTLERGHVRDYLEKVRTDFSTELDMTKYERKIMEKLAIQKDIENYVDKITQKMVGNIAFIHNAPHHSKNLVTKRLKENGIITVEVQHGYIASNSVAYNYPDGQQRAIIEKYLPDYLLTFGQYWSDQIRTPSKTINVGNRRLNNIRNDEKQKARSKKPTLLVISQPGVNDILVELSKSLSEMLPGYNILYKLHPEELYLKPLFKEEFGNFNVTISNIDDIYQNISSADVIIGHNSTVLFEAAAFDNKRIFFDDEQLPLELGQLFSDADSLCEFILKGDVGFPKTDSNYFWSPDWDQRIEDFLLSKLRD